MPVSSEDQRKANQRAYRRLKKRIAQSYPLGQYVGIVNGKIVADSPDFQELIANLGTIESNPERRLVVQAGVEYPRRAIEL